MNPSPPSAARRTETHSGQLLGAAAANRDHTNPSDFRVHPGVSRTLAWRGPWMQWQLLSLTLATFTAPTFWLTAVLLSIDTHSDHPEFWPAMMLLVPLTNLFTVVVLNQQHHRRPFDNRLTLAAHHLACSLALGCGLFSLLAWGTGLLGDFARPLGDAPGDIAFAADGLVFGAAIVIGFGLASFLHSGLIHAWIAFREPERFTRRLY